MSENQILRLTPAEVLEQALGPPVSLACAGDMHMSCLDWENCGCSVCHKICQNLDCQHQCRALYRIESAGMEVCAFCYKTMAPPVGRTTYCEQCEHPAAYRHPGKGDDRFLCSGCHVAAGHLTRQDRHDD